MRVPRSVPVPAALPLLAWLGFLLLPVPVDAQDVHPGPGAPGADRASRVAAAAAVAADIFRTHAERERLPGIAWGVMLDGTLVASDATGMANLAEEIPAGPRSLFRIASMSKSFTALAILQLRDEGRLSLDDPVSRWVPEMAGISYPTGDSPEITIRHLLTHSGGFPEDNPWGDRQLADTDQELRALVAAGPSFSTAPGVAYEYSNLGFALLGQVIQAASGLDFRDYTRLRIFAPLGMNHTVWEYQEASPGDLALGYAWIDDGWRHVPHERHGSFGAMGGLITSVEDFAAWVGLHQAAWPPRDGPESVVLRRSSLREMHQAWRFASLVPDVHPGEAAGGTGRSACPGARAYGYGLRWTRDCRGRTSVGHSGGLPGFGSDWAMLPEYGLAVFSFDNRTYAGTAAVNATVLDTLVALARLEPRRVPATRILARRMAELKAFLPEWDGARESEIFADNFFLDNRLEDLAARTRELWEAVGPVRSATEVEPWNRLRGTFFVEGERGRIQVLFTLTPEPEPRIQQVVLRLVEP